MLRFDPLPLSDPLLELLFLLSQNLPYLLVYCNLLLLLEPVVVLEGSVVGLELFVGGRRSE